MRNGEHDLPGFLDCVGRFADLVIALDDGSTDRTREILESSPIVTKVLANPRRESYAGWDDAANRRRLLEGLGEHDADWVLFLDADERLDDADAAALKRFVQGDAMPGFAYGFLAVQMVAGTNTYSTDSPLWVYRLFAFEPGLELPTRRLHFVPVPTAIPRTRWLRTTLRIQHFGGSDEARREARFQKYREADPLVEYQAEYESLRAEPVHTREWVPRSATDPVLADQETRFPVVVAETERELAAPVLSAVVIAQDDEATIRASLRALVDQVVEQPFEVILVHSGSDRTADIAREEFPSVRVIQLPRPALPGEARNAGLWVARGHYVSFPGSHIVVGPGSLQARIEAHEAGWDLVTGITLNGNPTRPGLASYFLDHSGVAPGISSRQLHHAPAHCSYVRRDLDLLGGFPEDLRAGEDTVVNQALFSQGRRAFLAEGATIVHISPCSTVRRLLRHHFGRGRGWGRILLERAGSRRRLVRRQAKAVLLGPWRRVAVVSRNVDQRGDDRREDDRRVRRLVVAGALAAGAGTLYQIGRGLPRARPAGPRSAPPAGTPAGPPILVAHQGSPFAPAFGILGLGSPKTAAQRAAGHAARQASSHAVPALYLVAIAAAATPGDDGTLLQRLPTDTVERYLAEARNVGARLIVGAQVPRGSFRAALAPYESILRQAGVGVGLDPGSQRAAPGDASGPGDETRWPRHEIEDALAWLSRVATTGQRMPVLIHSSAEARWPGDWAPSGYPGLEIIGVVDEGGAPADRRESVRTLALRAPAVGTAFRLRVDPEAPEPDDVARAHPAIRAVVYR